MKPVTQLRPGDRITYSATPCTILRSPEDTRDRFGRPTLAIWARREDTAEEGWLHYGPQVQVEEIS